MGSYYDTMQVCKRWGHKITDCYDSYPNHRQNHCEKCGSVAMFKCEYCNTKIRGYYHVEGVIGGGGPEVPLNCHHCGKSYPWKTRLEVKRVIVACISPLKYIIDSLVRLFKA